ncbi:MAG: 4-hydroxy-2-oxovalerate aldolase [Defluviimonas sp.]|nr:4-hydroxy-2-oxovalerate aldolase [Defluviimonas sp.]
MPGVSPHAVWLSTPHHQMVEIAFGLGCRRFVLDIEHGYFELDATDKLIALIRALGARVHAKVLGPETVAIQQALDMGCHGVIIPHIGGVDHARAVTAAAKYPPNGVRSFSGTRPARYDAVTQDYYTREDAATECLPMVESAEALAEIEAILALETVDGVFVGPSDLSLSRGRGAYARTEADFDDLRRIAAAARAAGKPWIMPAWAPVERDLARELGAAWQVTVDEYGALWTGIDAGLKA